MSEEPTECNGYDCCQLAPENAKLRERVAELEAALMAANALMAGGCVMSAVSAISDALKPTDTTGGNTATGAMHPQGGRRP